MAVQYFCKENADLILSGKVIAFAIMKLNELNTSFGNDLLENFEKRIPERSDVEIVYLLEYLKSRDLYDEFRIKIRKIK